VTEAATAPTEVPADGRRWGLGDAVLGFVVGQVGGLVLMSVLLSATGRTIDEVDDLPLSLLAIAQVGLWVGLLGVPLLATWRKGHGVVADLGLRARWADAWKGGLVGVVVQFPVLPILYAPILALLDKSASELEGPARDLTDRADDPLGVVLLILIVGVGAPIIEEIFYRGLLQRSLIKRGLPAGLAIGITSVVFGVSHFEALQLPGLVLAGAVFGVLAHRSGRLGPAIAAHVGFNLVTVVALLLA
jgi:membrane protease YdiL (CAAX protease family)